MSAIAPYFLHLIKLLWLRNPMLSTIVMKNDRWKLTVTIVLSFSRATFHVNWDWQLTVTLGNDSTALGMLTSGTSGGGVEGSLLER